jgi:hypothetical protein
MIDEARLVQELTGAFCLLLFGGFGAGLVVGGLLVPPLFSALQGWFLAWVKRRYPDLYRARYGCRQCIDEWFP